MSEPLNAPWSHDRRIRLLVSLNRHRSNSFSVVSQAELVQGFCRLLVEEGEFILAWASRSEQDGELPLLACSRDGSSHEHCIKHLGNLVSGAGTRQPVQDVLTRREPFICNDAQNAENAVLREMARRSGCRSFSLWPLVCGSTEFGILGLHSAALNWFRGEAMEYARVVVETVSLSLNCHHVGSRLQIERDFNREIVDSVHALLVSVGPGGQILSFNREAEQVSGYSQDEVLGRYWVDVLLTPEDRGKHQRKVTRALRGRGKSIHFQAPLLPRGGRPRLISWHGSIREQILGGDRVGLVLFGIDVTEHHETNQALDTAIARWENIFTAIQDPALIVNRRGRILDANPATLAAARKSRDEVVGFQVCDILHGGRQPGTDCPLEAFLNTGKARIMETELRGLDGHYLLTLSPLDSEEGDVTLLVARDLSEEEMIKAEAIRAAQLVAIGELAAGVAHEINNPVNGIMNYAQLLLDDLGRNSAGAELLERIINEGRRVSTIAHKLLDFARRREDHVEAASMRLLLDDCLDLIGHQLKKDGITLETHIAEDLPEIVCNAQQIQQVLLNILSNSRYALNQKFPKADAAKRITISAEPLQRNGDRFISLTVVDSGIGIEQDSIARLFDPFFSTKPKGEGTGLGLSISHGIIRDHNGFLRIQSELGSSTTVSIELPVVQDKGAGDA